MILMIFGMQGGPQTRFWNLCFKTITSIGPEILELWGSIPIDNAHRLLH